MEIKKIFAATVAGALAVSAMAISTSAVDLRTAGGPVYHATWTGNVTGNVANPGDKIVFPAVTVLDGDIKVEGYKVTVKAIANNTVATAEHSNKDGAAIEFTTNSAVSFDDFSKVAPNAQWQATVVIDINSTVKDKLKAADNDKTLITNDMYKVNGGKVTMNAETKQDVTVPTTITVGAIDNEAKPTGNITIKRSEVRALNENGGKLVLTLNQWGDQSKVDTRKLPQIVYMTITRSLDKNYSLALAQYITTDTKTVEFEIPKGLTMSTSDEMELFGTLTFTFGGDPVVLEGHNSDNSAGWDFKAGYELIINDSTKPANPTDEPVRSFTNTTPDGSVKVIYTDTALYGNGGADLQITNTMTSNGISYELKLTDANGKPAQPAGEVTLQLSIPTAFQGKTLKNLYVTHTCNDGTVEQLPIINAATYVTDKYVTVKTSKFSSFGMEFDDVETTTEAPVVTPAPEISATEATAAPSNTGNTSNSNSEDKNKPTGVVLAIVPAVIAAAGVIISKKRK